MCREDAHGKLELLPDGSFIVRRNPENGQYALGVRSVSVCACVFHIFHHCLSTKLSVTAIAICYTFTLTLRLELPCW